jgi:branched-chain amino acid transport system permease protein
VNQIALFSLLGLGQGALIAGVAVSLVFYYRGAGVINLAAGAVAMISGYAFWALRTGQFGHTFGTETALVLTLIVSILQGLVMEFAAFRPLRFATPLAKLVASLGLLLFAQAAMLLAFGPNEQSEPSFLPKDSVTVVGTPVPVDHFILAGIVLGCAVAASAVYRWTRFGISTRAAAENEASAMLAGLEPNSLSLVNTLCGSIIAGMLGVLAAPLITLNSSTLPLIVVPALAAALFARFTSFILACVIGLLLGSIENILYYLSTKSWFPTSDGVALPGVQDMLIFLLIICAMFWRSARLPRRHDIVEKGLPHVPRPKNLGRSAVLAALLGGIALTVFPYDFRSALMTSIIGVVLALSLVVITGFVGQISVVQLALSGATGFTMSHLASGAGIGFPLAPIIAVLIATLMGLVIAVGALRVRGVQLAIVTLAAAVTMTNAWFNNSSVGGGIGGAPVDQPSLFGLNLGKAASYRGLDGQQPSPILGYCLLAIAIGLCLLVANIRRGSFGLRMLAVRSNERAAAAVGINVAGVKVAAFGVGSFIAGVAGAMYAYNFGSVSADRFSALTALTVIAFTYIGGITMVTGAVIAGFLATAGLSEYAMQTWFGISGTWTLLFGGWAVLSNVIFWPDGIAGGLYKKREARRRRLALKMRPVSYSTGGDLLTTTEGRNAP